MLESALRHDFLINFAQVLGSLGGELPDCLVTIKPAPTWTDLQTVEEIVDCGVSYVERVHGVVQVLIKNISVSQAQNHQMTTFGHLTNQKCTFLSMKSSK